MFKTLGASQPKALGLRVTSSSLGMAIPWIGGRTRIQPRLIWANDFHTEKQSSKKGKGLKGKKGAEATVYFCAADFLLGHKGIGCVLATWKNKDYYPALTRSYSFTFADPPATDPTTGLPVVDLSADVPGGVSKFLGVIAVEYQDDVSGTFADYGREGDTVDYAFPTSRRFMANDLWPYGSWMFDDATRLDISSKSYLWNVDSGPIVLFQVRSGVPSFWPGRTVTIHYAYYSSKTSPLGLLGLEFEPDLGSGSAYTKYPAEVPSAATAAEFAGCGNSRVDMGMADMLPNYGLEVVGGYPFGNEYGDANPVDMILEMLLAGAKDGTVLFHGLNLPEIRDLQSLEAGASLIGDYSDARNWCLAHGMGASPYLDAQRPAKEWIQELCDIANADPVWSDWALSIIPRDEASYASETGVYEAPTADGPVADLDEDFGDFIVGSPEDPPVKRKEDSSKVSRADGRQQTDSQNIVTIEFIERSNQYQVGTVTDSNDEAVAKGGPQQSNVVKLHSILDRAIAQKICSVQSKRRSIGEETWEFTLPPNRILLKPRALVTVTCRRMGMYKVPFRLKSLVEDVSFNLQCEAEPFYYGLNSPDDKPMEGVTNNPQVTTQDPGSVNAPVFFEPRPEQTGGKRQLWIAVSGSDANYGGCAGFASIDGTWATPQGIGGLLGSSLTGYVYNSDYPVHADPDNVDDLYLDLTESRGTVESVDAAIRDAFQSLIYLAGGSTYIPYELVAYADAAVQATNKYKFPGASGIRRAVYGAPETGPAAHPIGSRAVVLDGNVIKIDIEDVWVGKTLHFKFAAFNQFGQNQQALADCVDYTYTILGSSVEVGAVVSSDPAVVISQGAGDATHLKTATFNATFKGGQVASYEARDGVANAAYAIADPGSTPKTYYISGYDPLAVGDAGAMANYGTAKITTYVDDNPDDHARLPGYVFFGKIIATHDGGNTGSVVGPAGIDQPLDQLVN